MILNRFTGLLLAVALAFTANAQKPVHLKSGTFFPTLITNQTALDSFMQLQPQLKETSSFYIQFQQLPSSGDLDLLKRAGVSLGQYLPDNSYEAVSSRGKLDKQILDDAHVLTLFSLSPDRKLDQALKQFPLPSRTVTIAGTADVWISVDPGWNDNEITTALGIRNLQIVNTQYLPYHVVVVRLAQHRLLELASMPFVRYVQASPGPDQALNKISRAGSGANVLNASLASGGKALRGEGVVIGVGDNSDVQSHVDFTGRLINRNVGDIQGHGTHTTGTVGGGGILDENYQGYATRSTLISSFFSQIWIDAPTYVRDYNMVLTNNSYGEVIECAYHGTYDITSNILDQMAISYPNLENVFAAGNSGASTCSPFQQSYHTVLGGYQSAKNTFCVGATTDSGMVTGFSSRGPVKDGRTKPEITALGTFVFSTYPVNSYGASNGTSMAAPAVTGGAALLYQRYRQLKGGADPYNALIKTIMMNGAIDRGLAGPDFSNGYGWMNLPRSLNMLEQQNYKIDSVSNAGTNTFTINVPSGTAALKVMLYWNDPAAAPLSTKALVNDLDLELVNTGGTTVLPLVPDTANAGLNTVAATQRADHLNNTEQIVVSNPAAGTYTIRVKGTAVAQGPRQTYVIAYDPVPAQMQLSSPMADESYYPDNSYLGFMRIRWDAPGLTGNADIEFSADNGGTWSTIASGIDVGRQFYSWPVPDTATAQARIRVKHTSGTQIVTSGAFRIMQIPSTALSAIQCPGYINLSWTAVKGATDYEVMMLRGDSMQAIATTTALSYSFDGLSTDTNYVVSVRPRINGAAGLRGFGRIRKPDNGTCAGSFSDNDLSVQSLDAPKTGRQFTSTQWPSSSTVQVTIRNSDDVAQSNYSVSYSVNNGSWVTENVSNTIAANSTATYSFATPVATPSTGSYQFRIAVTNNNVDSHKGNDTLIRTVRYLSNPQIIVNSPQTDDLESSVSATYLSDTIGFTGADRFDLNRTTVYGRARTFVNTGIAHSGIKAISLDVDRYLNSPNTNYLTATYNLSNYTVATTDLRIDFWYMSHGQSSGTENKVWVRGSDTDPWIQAYDLFANQASTGSYRKSGSIEISRLLAQAGQQFSPGTQIKWGQTGSNQIVNKDFMEGYTFDDIRVYKVVDDVELSSIDAPESASCGLSAATQIKITVRNPSNSPRGPVDVKYRINGGSWVSGSIASVPAYGNVNYTFPTTANMSAFGNYTVEAAVNLTGDSFQENDTLVKQVRNLPVISSYPYIQNFEQDSGYWYPGGKNSSWEYGTPSSPHVNRAASGSKAWKTRLSGYYNNNELSYFYSPCFNLTGLTSPTLSFSVALDIEDCGTQLCDGAWVEYSTDGTNWTKLGNSGQGYNWYNQSTYKVWSVQDYSRWHVATIPIPSVTGPVRFRFVMFSDPGVTREGIAIDDIHIYDNIYGIYTGTANPEITQAVSGSSWVDFTQGGKLLSSVLPQGQSLGQTKSRVYINSGTVRNTGSQYYADRSITIKPTTRDLTDSVRVRFYFLDAEVDSMIKATNCPGCVTPTSAYDLGVSKYTDVDTSFENGSIADDQAGTWYFYPFNKISLVPFDKGYYAEFAVKNFSEFWLNTGGINGGQALPVKLVSFTAVRQGGNALIAWDLASETNVNFYQVEVARGDQEMQSNVWHSLNQTPSLGNTSSFRHYSFLDTEPGKSGPRYYRLKIVNQDGSVSYSPIRSLIFAHLAAWELAPNPTEGIVSLTYQLDISDKLEAGLYSAAGQLIRNYNVQGNGGVQKLNVDLTMQASGIYLLRVRAAGEEKHYRLLRK